MSHVGGGLVADVVDVRRPAVGRGPQLEVRVLHACDLLLSASGDHLPDR